MKPKIMVIDIGGSHVKLMMSRSEKRKFDSGPKLTPKRMIAEIGSIVEGWEFDAVSIGFPSVIRKGKVVKNPNNLAAIWAGWSCPKLLGKPVRIINDAAMQALGSYHGGRMLFLGLGTGLGSTLIWDRNVLPLELGDLPYTGGTMIEDHIGKRGLERLGKKVWQAEVENAVARLQRAFVADYVVLGGGNAKQFKKMPAGAEPGHNRNAYLGGVRLWATDPKTGRPKWNVIS